MRSLQFSARAERDLRALETYWMPRDPELVRAFYAESKTALRFLLETPGAGSPIDTLQLRKWKVGRTPFLLLYTFDTNTLSVVRIRHEREDWRRTL